MITSTIHVLIITPVIFYSLKGRALRRGTLKVSSMGAPEDGISARGRSAAPNRLLDRSA